MSTPREALLRQQALESQTEAGDDDSLTNRVSALEEYAKSLYEWAKTAAYHSDDIEYPPEPPK